MATVEASFFQKPLWCVSSDCTVTPTFNSSSVVTMGLGSTSTKPNLKEGDLEVAGQPPADGHLLLLNAFSSALCMAIILPFFFFFLSGLWLELKPLCFIDSCSTTGAPTLSPVGGNFLGWEFFKIG
jgi:hypothetical protein